MKVENKSIILSGGSSGVGLNLLRRLAPKNRVTNLSRREPDLGHSGLSFSHISTDLGDPDSLAAALERIRSENPEGIDGLINCAAVQYTPCFTDSDFDPRSISREIAINFTSPIELIAASLDLLQRQEDAFILNVNSGLSIVPKRESAVYCATKSGLDNFTRGLRAQLAQTSIRVQQSFLPLVATPMTEGRGTGKLSSDHVARLIVRQLERGQLDLDFGKVGLLRLIHRVAPALAHRIMQKGDA